MPPHDGNSTSVFRRFQKRKDIGVWEDVTTMLGKMRSLNQRFAPGTGS